MIGLLLVLALGYTFVVLIKYFVLVVLLCVAIWSFWSVIKKYNGEV